MKLPKQSKPVMRYASTAKIANNGVEASDLKCTACCTACDLLPMGVGLCKKGCGLLPGCSC